MQDPSAMKKYLNKSTIITYTDTLILDKMYLFYYHVQTALDFVWR